MSKLSSTGRCLISSPAECITILATCVKYLEHVVGQLSIDTSLFHHLEMFHRQPRQNKLDESCDHVEDDPKVT